MKHVFLCKKKILAYLFSAQSNQNLCNGNSYLQNSIPTSKLTNPKSQSKIQVQVQTDNWVFIKLRFPNRPPPATQVSFKEARYSNISKTKVLSILGGCETCFGIGLDQKSIHWESKLAENLQSKNYLTMQNRAISTNWKQIFQQLTMIFSISIWNIQVAI